MGPVSSPFLHMYLQGLASVESDNEEQEETTPPTDSMDASLFQSIRGLRKKPWTKIEGRAPWTREEPWTIEENGVRREMTLEEKLVACRNMDKYNEIIYNDAASQVFDGVRISGGWEKLLRHNARVLNMLSMRNSAFIAKAQAERHQMSDAQKAINLLTKEVDTWRKKFGEKQIELDNLKINYKEMEIMTSADAEKVIRLGKRVEELEGQLRDSQKECSDEKAKVLGLEIERERLMMRINVLKTRGTNLQTENATLRTELGEALQKAEDWEDNCKSLEETKKILEADIQAAEDGKNEALESLPDEKAEHLTKFLKSEAFARASLVASQNTVEQTLYWAVKEIGAVKGFTPEEFGLKDSTGENVDLSTEEWDEEEDAFIFEGKNLPDTIPINLTIPDPNASGSGKDVTG